MTNQDKTIFTESGIVLPAQYNNGVLGIQTALANADYRYGKISREDMLCLDNDISKLLGDCQIKDDIKERVFALKGADDFVGLMKEVASKYLTTEVIPGLYTVNNTNTKHPADYFTGKDSLFRHKQTA